VKRIVVALAILAIAAPLVWTLLASFSPETGLYRARFVPSRIVLDHWRALFATRDIWRPIRNSIVVAASTTICCVLLGAPCAYAMVRLRFRGRALVLGATLAVGMFPQIAIVAPLYLLLRALHLIDTYPGLVLPYLTFAMPLTVWLLSSTFRQLPADVEEAAMVDGASRVRVLWEIVLPLAAPGIATAAMLTFIYAWNEFLFALSFTTGPARQTVPVALALFRGQHQIPWGEILAATTLSTLPVLALVVLFQRRITSGLTAGSIK
jgi:ABC-type glycerol-3-phosphate transport system permease component